MRRERHGVLRETESRQRQSSVKKKVCEQGSGDSAETLRKMKRKQTGRNHWYLLLGLLPLYE